jgi:hypothetical protein
VGVLNSFAPRFLFSFKLVVLSEGNSVVAGDAVSPRLDRAPSRAAFSQTICDGHAAVKTFALFRLTSVAKRGQKFMVL